MKAVLSLALALLLLSSARGATIQFSVDPASPAIDGIILTPDDIFEPGAPLLNIATEGSDLGLADDFLGVFGGSFDNLNALSYGNDRIPTDSSLASLFFSVDRVAVGLPGTDVEAQAQPGAADAAGDIFLAVAALNTNLLIRDEQTLGMTPGFFGDDLDALDMSGASGGPTYFSIDALSETNGFGTAGLADDLLISGGGFGFATYADGVNDIGLVDGDDIDALMLFDQVNPGVLDPGEDMALFSLSSFSPSVLTAGQGGTRFAGRHSHDSVQRQL